MIGTIQKLQKNSIFIFITKILIYHIVSYHTLLYIMISDNVLKFLYFNLNIEFEMYKSHN